MGKTPLTPPFMIKKFCSVEFLLPDYCSPLRQPCPRWGGGACDAAVLPAGDTLVGNRFHEIEIEAAAGAPPQGWRQASQYPLKTS